MKLKELLSEANLITNLSDSNFDGSDPETIEHIVGDLRFRLSLQGTRRRIAEILKKMTKEAEVAMRGHKYSYVSMKMIKKEMEILNIYIDAHQQVIEELESIRKKGGVNSKKVPVKFDM